MGSEMNRREFLRSSAATGAAVALGTGLTAEAAPKPRIVVARGGGAPDSNEGALARMKAAPLVTAGETVFVISVISVSPSTEPDPRVQVGIPDIRDRLRGHGDEHRNHGTGLDNKDVLI